MNSIFDGLQNSLLRIAAIDAKNRGVELTGKLKEVFEGSSPDQIAETEIELINAEYILEEINEAKTCPDCDGEGEVPSKNFFPSNPNIIDQPYELCGTCKGSGIVENKKSFT